MKQLEQTFEKQYEPIEPEGTFQNINPYRGSLKFIIENIEKRPARTFLEFMALFLAPGGTLYSKKECNNIQKEICFQKGKKFKKIEFLEEFDITSYMIEPVKFPIAYLLSDLASKLIF